ncbi:MAG: PDZ domain-containing protein [Acidobacteriota bacterium]
MRKFLLALGLAWVVAAGWATAFAQETVPIPPAVRRALCRVEIERSQQRRLIVDGVLIPEYQPVVRQADTFLGITVDEDGHIIFLAPPPWSDLTQTTHSVRVFNSSRVSSPARVVGIDHRNSIVVLRALAPTLFQPIIFEAFPEDSTRVRYVQWTSPIVVHLRESVVSKLEKFPGLPEYRASIAGSGDLFGAPVLDAQGRLTGMISDIDPVRGHYYIIPSQSIQASLKRVLGGETEIASGWAGIYLQEAKNTRYPVWVRNLTPDGPALRGGLQLADQIQSVNGTPIDSMLLFVKLIRQNAPFSTVRLGVDRTGKLLKTVFTLGLRKEKEVPVVALSLPPNAANNPSATPVTVHPNRFRARVGAFFDNADDSSQEGLAVTKVVEGEAGDLGGLRPGDVILSANGDQVKSRQDWELALSAARAPLLQLKIRRDSKVVYLQVQLQ